MPIPGDQYWEQVTLLLHADATVGTGTTLDVSTTPKTPVATGTAIVSDVNPAFGGGSLSIPSLGNYWSIPNAAGGAFGANDFTLEFWIRVVSATGSTPVFFSIGRTIADTTSYAGLLLSTAGFYIKLAGTTGSWTLTPSAGNLGLTDGLWHAVAVSRVGASLYLFVDGVQRGVINVGTSAILEQRDAVGFLGFGGVASSSAASYFVDEVRLTLGVGRYSANYTPQGPFPEPLPKVSEYKIESVVSHAGFVAPSDVRARTALETVVVGPTTRISDLRVESILGYAIDQPADLRAASVVATVIAADNTTVSRLFVESIVSAPFNMPADLRGSAVYDYAVVAAPKEVRSQQFAVESLLHGYLERQSQQFKVESIYGLPYSVIGSQFYVESIVESTVQPPQAQTAVMWFTVVNP